MLSPGEWWKKVPKGLAENLKFRRKLLSSCKSDWDGNRAREGVREACGQDLLFSVSALTFTYDPRCREKSVPFIAWPVQDRAFLNILECVENGIDLVIEKSRDMGASWMSLTTMEWLWRYHPGMSFLMVSRKEDLVDAPGDPDSLFWKVDFIHRHLPDWLRPHADRRKLHFGNLGNGSTIDGESTTAAAGVGGRRTAMFIDEFSRIEEGYQLLAGTADTTRCRIFNFTPFGTSNAAYKLARRGDVRKLRLHWSQHPDKNRGMYRSVKGKIVLYVYDPVRNEAVPGPNFYEYPPDFQFVMDGLLRSPVYDEEDRRRSNRREMAQMWDIDYASSAYQFFDAPTVMELSRSYACAPYWEGDVTFDAETGKPYELVKNTTGLLKLWCHLDGGRPPASDYGAGADLAWGTGATASCFTVVDGKTGHKVLEYADPFIRPDLMAPKALALCLLFLDERGEGARFAWEQQGPGVPFGNRVMELGYRNIFYRTNPQKFNPKPDADTPGWVASPDGKRKLLTEYREALSKRWFINRSWGALEECLFFEHTETGTIEHKGGNQRDYDPETGKRDPSGAGVNHGDRVIADALAWMMVRTLGEKARKKADHQAAPLSSLAGRRALAEARRLQEEVA